MINFKTEEGIFNFRVAGILLHKNRVLIHRSMKDDFYAFPGGRVEMFENTEETIVREMEEELEVTVEVDRLLWICEHFFDLNGSKYHEICYYYLIRCEDARLLERDDLFYGTEEQAQLEFRWVSLDGIQDEPLYPTFIKKRLSDLPPTIERVVDFGE